METFIAFGILGALAAIGWSLTDRGRGERARPPGRDPRPLAPPLPDTGEPTGTRPDRGTGVAREHEVDDDVTSLGVVHPPSMATWSALLAPRCLRADLQLPYVLQWIRLESGGNPCDVGDPRQHGPDGNPREVGIAQFFNPDDLVRLRVTGSALRAYCVPGDQHEVTYKGRVVRGFSKALARPLTPAEMAEQADLAVSLVLHCAEAASRDLAAIRAGPAWNRTRRDYWSLVKLQHGLPGISHSGLARVTQKLGRPPRDWAEFRATLPQVTLDPGTEKYRAEFPRILQNAEDTSRVFSQNAIA